MTREPSRERHAATLAPPVFRMNAAFIHIYWSNAAFIRKKSCCAVGLVLDQRLSVLPRLLLGLGVVEVRPAVGQVLRGGAVNALSRLHATPLGTVRRLL